ncbi:chaperone [Lithospermum erythrorhizon]|uniref:Chaperone n=1 Tax=Lithospermum erythrorhizon TaxID=34254 RepID=A0AAV3RA53_LITER
MDHYKVLGISKNATKDEIKQAYFKLAMQFHPDKHAHSPKPLQESANFKFKLISQAYETLIDDKMRADYNIKNSRNPNNNKNNNYSQKGNYEYGRSKKSGFGGYGYGYSGRGVKGGGRGGGGGVNRGGGVGLKMEVFFSYLNTKSFLLNAAFFGFLLAGSVVINSGGKSLWEMRNSGKSFEDAMESIEKAKKLKDKT